MSIIEYITPATYHNLKSRFLRKNTKDSLAGALAEMWPIIHDLDEGDKKRDLIRILTHLV